MGNSTKELVKAFNLNNYFSDKINANFTVEGKKIVGLFASSTNIGEYLRRIGEEIIERHYLSGTEVARKYYNLDCFPFVLGANADKEDLGNGIVKVKLADSTDPAVIHNLKINFANEFERAVISKVVARLQEEVKITKKEAYEWIRGTVGTGAIGMPYLYCIAFSNVYFGKRYFPRIFELFKSLYTSEFNSRLEACGLKNSDFYEYKDDMLYIKDVSDKVVKSVAEYVKKEVALDFRIPGSVESKVENCKNVLSELIYRLTGKYVEGYDYDDFIDENKIKNGHSFALIPLDNQYETLSFNDAKNINRISNKGICNHFHCISDIRGKTANPQFANCKEPVYAFSNKQIAFLLPIIMRSPIAYNQINGRFEFAVDLENFKRRGSSQSSSTVTSPIHTGPSGLRTPLKQTGDRFEEDRYSGIGESPSKPEDSAAHSPSGDPGPSSKVSQVSPPRQGSMLHHNLGAAEVGAAESGSAWTSQPMGVWALPASSAGLWSLSQSGPSSSKGASERRTSDKPLTEEEEKLIKELLYVFNINNQVLECPYTNFIVENGKIASSINDGVNVKEYLLEVRGYTIKEYCGTEEEAKKAYDLNEFPFKFLSNCEKNQKTTVVANISRGALLNLKKLFIQEHEKKVEIEDIDINIVKKAAKSKKKKWGDSQVQAGVLPDPAFKTCYPDKSVLKHIPIIKDKGGYRLDRTYESWETKSFFKELWPAKGISVAGKGSSKAKEKTSDYYSMSEHTDHEESSPMQQQNSSQNTRGGSPKRRSQSPVGEDSPRKFPKRESNNSSSEEAGGSPR